MESNANKIVLLANQDPKYGDLKTELNAHIDEEAAYTDDGSEEQVEAVLRVLVDLVEGTLTFSSIRVRMQFDAVLEACGCDSSKVQETDDLFRWLDDDAE
jgi:hypothetical protein